MLTMSQKNMKIFITTVYVLKLRLQKQGSDQNLNTHLQNEGIRPSVQSWKDEESYNTII